MEARNNNNQDRAEDDLLIDQMILGVKKRLTSRTALYLALPVLYYVYIFTIGDLGLTEWLGGSWIYIVSAITSLGIFLLKDKITNKKLFHLLLAIAVAPFLIAALAPIVRTVFLMWFGLAVLDLGI